MKLHLIWTLCTCLPFWGMVAESKAAILTFEEVGMLSEPVEYFSQIGKFSGTWMDPQTSAPADGMPILDTAQAYREYLSVSSSNVLDLRGSASTATEIGFRNSRYKLWLTEGGTFNYLGAYFAREGTLTDGAGIELSGYLNGELVLFQNIGNPVIPVTGSPIWFGVDTAVEVDYIEITLDSYANGYATMDDFTYSISSVPIPSAIWLFGAGLLSLLSFSRSINTKL